jgi:hypothetical protein
MFFSECKFDRRCTWFFSKKIFVSDSNEIAVSYRIGCVEFRHRESSAHRPHLLVWKPKIAKNLSFSVFCEFLLSEKIEVKFFGSKEAH